MAGERLTVGQAADLVRVSESTLRRMIRDGAIHAEQVKRGGRTLVFVQRAELLKAMGTGEADVVGAGAIARRRGRRPARGDGGEVVAVLREEISRLTLEANRLRDENRDLRAELARLHEKLEAKNAELVGVLREGRDRPRGIAGLLVDAIRGRRGG